MTSTHGTPFRHRTVSGADSATTAYADVMRIEWWRGRVAALLCVLAVGYSAGLLLSVVVIPTIDDQTLLQYGGPWSLAIFAQPLLMSGLTWHVLRRRCHTGGDMATTIARTFAPVYLVYSIIGGFSLAAGALPAALLIVGAVALTPRGSAPSARPNAGP